MNGKKAERRNVLETPPTEESLAMWRQFLSQFADPEKLEEKEPEKKDRNREWEKKHRPKHYRGIPGETRQEIKEIAQELEVSADEVARAFFEYSLHCIEKGELTIAPKSSRARRMTLFPFNGANWAADGWTPQAAKQNIRKRKKETTLWREEAAYRIPDELHKRVKRLASDMVAVGEIALILLKHGISSYQSGTLALIPQPKTTLISKRAGDKE